jgi:hypothetical protein
MLALQVSKFDEANWTAYNEEMLTSSWWCSSSTHASRPRTWTERPDLPKSVMKNPLKDFFGLLGPGVLLPDTLPPRKQQVLGGNIFFYCVFGPHSGHGSVALRLFQDSVAAERQKGFLCLFRVVAYFSRFGSCCSKCFAVQCVGACALTECHRGSFPRHAVNFKLKKTRCDRHPTASRIAANRRPVPQGCTVTLVLRVGVSLTSYSHIVQREPVLRGGGQVCRKVVRACSQPQDMILHFKTRWFWCR